MIDIAARAIAVREGATHTYDNFENYRNQLKYYAGTVIAALLNPTEEMKHAKDKAGDEIHYDYNCHVCGGIKDAYEAMIKAALVDK